MCGILPIFYITHPYKHHNALCFCVSNDSRLSCASEQKNIDIEIDQTSEKGEYTAFFCLIIIYAYKYMDYKICIKNAFN